MHVLSVPVVASLSIIASAGFYHLFIFNVRRTHRENLTFALSCFAFALYGVCCAGLYSSTTLAQGAAWQRMQVAIILLAGILFLWFMNDYTKMVSHKALWGFSVMGALCAAAGLVLPAAWTWSLARPSIKTINLPFGIHGIYYEVEPAFLMALVQILGTVSLAYTVYVGMRFYQKGPRDKARPLLPAVLILFACVANDVSISTGLYVSVYLLEYGFLAVTTVMALSMADQVVKAVEIRQTLRENEERYRVLAENGGFTVWTMDMDLKWTYIGESFARLTGFSVEESMGHSLEEMLTPDSAAHVRETVGAQLAAELESPGSAPRSLSLEVQLRRKKQQPLWVEVTAAFLRDNQGKPVGVVGLTRDISVVKAAEEDLLFVQRAVDTSADAVAMCDAQNRHFYHNTSFAQMFGYQRPEEVVRVGGPLALFADQAAARKITRAINETGAWSGEVEMIAKSGRRIATELRAHAIRDKQGRFLGLMGIHTDITEKKAVQQALLGSEERYRLVAENTSDVIWTTGLDLQWTYVSPSVFKLRGFTPEEAMAQRLDEVLTDDSARETVQLLTEELEKELTNPGSQPRSMTVEMEFRKKDGSTVWGESSCSFLRDENGQLAGMIGITRDTTERRLAEEALMRSEEKYRTILETMDEGYYECDLRGNISFVNASVCAKMGYAREEFCGMNNRLYATPESAARMMQVFAQVHRTGMPDSSSRFEVITKGGAHLFVDLSVALMKNGGGQPVGFRGVVRDVTKIVQAEEAREKLEERLHQAQKLEAVGTLAGGVAHDFNNLLMGMQGNLSLMLLGLSEKDPQYKRLKNIEQYIVNASGLTKQLLGFARSGKYQVRTTGLRELVERTAAMFGRTKKEIQMQTTCQPDLWPVEVDHGQIEQVLLNLFVNAWQAMPQGGSLFLRLENTVLDARQAAANEIPPGKYVKLSVTDTGVGMDEDTLKRVFDPFFTTKEISRGTGLGLASAYGIIKNHGGAINAYSQKGHGATFTICLPASEKTVSPEPETEQVILPGSETILLIDDEDIIINTGGEILEALGYTALTARGARKALEIYGEQHSRIDLVIMDMIMPEMQGNELYDALKDINPQVKVLLSSGYSIDGQASRIMDKGCDGFIQKPFNLEQLSQKIREILDEK